MEITLYCTMPGEGRRSMEAYADQLIQGLAGLLPSATALRVHRPGDLRPSWSQGWPPARKAFQYLSRYVGYQMAAPRVQGDVNHIVDHGYGHLLFSLDARRTIVTFHDAMLLKLRERALSTSYYPTLTIWGHLLSLRGIRRAARVITVSESVRQDFLRYLPFDPQRVRTIYEGVNPLFRPLADPSLTEPLRRRYDGERGHLALHVGHCAFYKNVEGMLEALAHLNGSLGLPVRLIQVGGEPTSGQRRLVGSLGLEERVSFLGSVSQEELILWYNAADVLLLPSLYEGFGWPALEAMACGTPVVASTAGALPEVAGDAALLVEPTDPKAIAQGVALVLRDESLRRRLIARGLERARCFTWERTAQETLALYQEVYQEVSGGC